MPRRLMRTIAYAVALTALMGLAYSGLNLWGEWREYKEGDDVYANLSREARPNPSPSPSDSSKAATRLVDIPDIGLDKSILQADMAAWLYGPDTVIDYPVMAPDNYNYYLGHLPDGTPNKNGALFLDYNCKPDFSDRLNIIYGHNMKSGKMFGSLVGYKKQDYYDKHPYMYLYTPGGNYRIDIMYGFVISAMDWSQQGFVLQENVDLLLEYAERESTFSSTVQYMQEDRLVVMSTCSYEFYEARYAVIGVMRPEFSQVDMGLAVAE